MTQQPGQDHRSFYDRISRAYDLIADAGERRCRERGEEALALEPGETVLELGFGTGNSLLRFAQSVGAEGRVCGLDISAGMKSVTEKKLDRSGFRDRVELTTADARHLPFADDSFDAVFTSFTLELFEAEDIPQVLAEVRRVLAPGGRLAVVAMAAVEEGEKPSILERTYLWMHHHFPHIVDCRPIDVVRWLREAAFSVESVVEMEIWSMPVRTVVGRPLS